MTVARLLQILEGATGLCIPASAEVVLDFGVDLFDLVNVDYDTDGECLILSPAE